MSILDKISNMFGSKDGVDEPVDSPAGEAVEPAAPVESAPLADEPAIPETPVAPEVTPQPDTISPADGSSSEEVAEEKKSNEGEINLSA